MRLKHKLPFISIIIPVKYNPNIRFTKKCLQTIRKQTYISYEVILVTDQETANNLSKLLRFRKNEKIITGDWKKSAARNEGAKNAKGDFLLHIDIDYSLPVNILALCVDVISKKQATAIILHEKIDPARTIWQKARKLERKIALHDITMSAPQLIEKNLFNKIGGFDERIDALDDWVLALKLNKLKVRVERITNTTNVYEPVNPLEIFHHRYYKGQYIPLLKNLYVDVPQLSFSQRLHAYKKNIRVLLMKPHVTFALLILKFFDLVSLFLGTLNPVSQNLYEDPYQKKEIAKYFDKENKQSNSVLYKHYQETKALLNIFQSAKRNEKILELGAGTGRITKVLTENGFNVTPTDISQAMLDEYKKKLGLPNPVLIKDSSSLPFKSKSFSHTVSLRVIWHILYKQQREKFFSEAVRVSKKTIVLDLTNKQRYRLPLVSLLIKRLSPTFYDSTYYYSKKEIELLAKKHNLIIKKVFHLEVFPPFFLSFLPRSTAMKLFAVYSEIEKLFQDIIPPGRFLIQFERGKT